MWDILLMWGGEGGNPWKSVLAAQPREEGPAGLSSAEDLHTQGQPRWALPSPTAQ